MLETSPFSFKEEESISSEEEIQPCTSDLLIVHRLLQSHSLELDQSQRENLFHTRCKVLDDICSLIVDIGSCYNCCSSRLVHKLFLKTHSHLSPYKLHPCTIQVRLD